MFASLSEAQIRLFVCLFVCLFVFLQSLGYKRVSTFKLGSIILLEQNSCKDLFWYFLQKFSPQHLYVSSLYILKRSIFLRKDGLTLDLCGSW